MFELSKEGQDFVRKELTRYESVESAIIPSLYQVQKENKGWVSEEAVSHLSQIMNIPESRIHEVLQFYTMFNKKPVGCYHVQICCNVACAMAGSREMAHFFLKKYKVKEGEMTSDGHFTFTRVECLGACDKAPMMQINEDYHEDLSLDSAKELLDSLES